MPFGIVHANRLLSVKRSVCHDSSPGREGCYRGLMYMVGRGGGESANEATLLELQKVPKNLVDLHLFEALLSLDPDNLQLRCIVYCSFFCPLEQ